MSSIRDQVVQSLAASIACEIDKYWFTEPFQQMGSEIERAFAAAFLIGVSRMEIRFTTKIPDDDFVGVFLIPQFQIGDYRVDFLLGSGKRRDLARCVVIECDGHAFHEKTKEQVARDKSRDRAITKQTRGILRFSGSEIYRDVAQCVVDALDLLARAHE